MKYQMTTLMIGPVAVGLLSIWLSLAGLPSGLAAEEADQSRGSAKAAMGGYTYKIYCSNCHGVKAKGDGSLAEMLTTKPTDLTILASENDGKFPTEQVTANIDGRENVRGHGMKEMPVWGDVLQVSGQEPEREGETAEERAESKVEELVLFLESIQEEPIQIESAGK